ncbi:hypothetical protein GWK47_004916 [Chionoecetes opilio]|uniref:Uncharacterized protein n=1 Tax=Chionoecetes opilio TaxID=41210 RepID=A0A8J5D089_CHIOP|nr:hypothetical protein GWK47_004916 [Chionoecetes opilio]
MTKEETTQVSPEVIVPTLPCQENYVHLHNCVTRQSPLYFCHLTHKYQVSTLASPAHYEIPEVRREHDARRKHSLHQTQEMPSSYERKSEYFEGATFRQEPLFLSVAAIKDDKGGDAVVDRDAMTVVLFMSFLQLQ